MHHGVITNFVTTLGAGNISTFFLYTMQSNVCFLVTWKGVILTSADIRWPESHWCPPSLNSTPIRLMARRLDCFEAPNEKVYKMF